MILACHQPNFMPWSGLFFKALIADEIVLLDDVQFPLGGSWVNRNRLKNDQGELWLTVPVWKRGRSLQRLDAVEICYDEAWQKKHILSLEHAYKHAPYWEEHGGFFRQIYGERWRRLLELNLAIIDYLRLHLGIDRPSLLSSAFAVTSKGSERLADICRAVGATAYLTIASSKKYLKEEVFHRSGIQLLYYTFEPPVYPQLWGEFRANLSVVDLLLTCGPKSAHLIRPAGRLLPPRNPCFCP
ncbi:MAG TPA: WbqC family protein [Syntrophobacteria bacterium]|nr:WbqC family protein [Syntrophobacteria bacterium]